MIHSNGFHTVGTSQPLWPVALAALAIGALLAAPYVIRVLSASVNIEVLASVLGKLLASDNPGRAIKLTQAAPASPHCTAVRAALFACRDGAAFRPREQADYRSGAFDASPPQVVATVRGCYDEAFEQALRPIARVRVPAALAVVLLLAAVISPWMLGDVPIPLPIVAALGVVAVLFAARSDRRMIDGSGVLFQTLGEHFARLALKPEAFGEMTSSMTDDAMRNERAARIRSIRSQS